METQLLTVGIPSPCAWFPICFLCCFAILAGQWELMFRLRSPGKHVWASWLNVHFSSFTCPPHKPWVSGVCFWGAVLYGQGSVHELLNFLCSFWMGLVYSLESALNHRTGLSDTVNYLNNFLFGTFWLVSSFVDLAGETQENRGLLLSLTFLGIDLDTMQQCCRLPVNNLWELNVWLAAFQSMQKVTLLDLR